MNVWESDDLVQNVSHELNTALTTVLGNAHFLRSKGEALDPVTRMRALCDLEEHAERLFSAIQNLLLLVRLEMGEEAYLEPVVLPRLLEDLAGQSHPRAEGRVRLDLGELRSLIAVDRNLFRVVLRNLVENAVLYGPPGGHIDVVARDEGDQVVVAVRDEGPGISERERELVFEPFYRSPAVFDTLPGLGLGLTVARRLVQLHGGDIQVASGPDGKGTCLEVRLPAVRSNADGELGAAGS